MGDNILSEFSNNRRTWTVKSELPVSFELRYSTDVFNPVNHDLASLVVGERAVVVIDTTVYGLYKDRLEDYFETKKLKLRVLILDSTEDTKTWESTDEILKFFERHGLLRREPVIAIGGGVLLDLVGFACSIYRRGVPYIKVPTTLLGIVDASVGVKVGANHLERRNRIGAYYPPTNTLIDKKFIGTQDERNIVNGICEIFKLALIKDAELFDLLENNSDLLLQEKFQFGAVPVKVINLAITGMVDELAPNLWERRLDRCVDFGHTFSPMIEMKNIPDLYHGEAVVLDCLLSSCISFSIGHISKEILNRIFSTAKKLKLPTFHKDFTDIRLLKDALADTVKHRNGNQYLPLPIAIGNYYIMNNLRVRDIEGGVNCFIDIQ